MHLTRQMRCSHLAVFFNFSAKNITHMPIAFFIPKSAYLKEIDKHRGCKGKYGKSDEHEANYAYRSRLTACILLFLIGVLCHNYFPFRITLIFSVGYSSDNKLTERAAASSALS